MKSINKLDLKSLFKDLSIASANTVAGRTITIDREDYGDIVGVDDGPLLMEEWGSGYRRIVTACNAHNYPIPGWQEIGSVIRLVFFSSSTNKRYPISGSERGCPCKCRQQ